VQDHDIPGHAISSTAIPSARLPCPAEQAVSGEELVRKFHDNTVRSLPEERAAEIAARTLALPDAQSVEDLTALLTPAGER
jgi:hypothetical protein